MGQSGENEVGSPAWERPRFVADLSRCLADWERALAAPVLSPGGEFSGLLERSRGLCERSKTIGFGGIGLHLSELVQRGGSSEPGPAREQLQVVRDMLESARRSLTPAEAAWEQGQPLANTGPAIAVGPAANAGFDAAAPPPMLSMVMKAPAFPQQAPPPAPVPPFAPAAAAPSPGVAPPRSLFESQLVQAPAQLSQSAAPAPPPAIAAPPPVVAAPPPVMAPPPPMVASQPPVMAAAPPPVIASPPPVVASPPIAAPPFHAPPPPPAAAFSPGPGAAPLGAGPAPAGRPAQPNLGVRPVLGLRGFGKGQAGPGPMPAVPANVGAPAGQQSSVLGLKRGGSSAPPPASLEPPAPPPLVGLGYGGLPAAERESRSPSRFPGSGPGSRTPLPPRGDDAHQRDPGRSEGPARKPRKRFEQAQGDGGKSWIGIAVGLGVVVVGAIVFIVVMATRRGETPTASPSSPSASASPDSSSAAADDAALPKSRLLTENERFRAMLSQVHGRGGKETPELRALIDEHAALAAEAVSAKGCQGPNCKALAEIGKIVQGGPKLRVKRRSRSPDALRSKWLAGLKMPEIAVEDDPRVQRSFEFYTENPQGRETFQQMLFRCGEYQDQIQAALIRHSMPADLIAVAFAESSCYPLAKSPVGAEGLWQFIPEAARAYHLRIIPDQVDERHSPQKSTEAAIRFLKDMYTKFNDWDLVFAGYNCGPFGVAARLERIEGDNVGFWELVDAELLPDETANYAPAIQAIALILNNLQRLKFAGVQRRAPRLTMDLTVPPSTRLSLVAKAAAMSLQDLLRLNLDLKGTTTPQLQNFAVQVPKDSVWQARDTLQELLKTGDKSDMCVPPSFDWGRQRFTTEMAEACARTQSAQAKQ